jgi:hypothetical protein
LAEIVNNMNKKIDFKKLLKEVEIWELFKFCLILMKVALKEEL